MRIQRTSIGAPNSIDGSAAAARTVDSLPSVPTTRSAETSRTPVDRVRGADGCSLDAHLPKPERSGAVAGSRRLRADLRHDRQGRLLAMRSEERRVGKE